MTVYSVFDWMIPHKKLETRLSYGEDPESLSHLALNPYRVVTDRIAIANTRSQQYLPVQLWRVKMEKS